MAKFEMRKLISIFLMMLFVVAQSEKPLPHSSISKNSIGGEVVCAGKCAFKCRRFINKMPIYAGCVAACNVLKCRKIVSQVVQKCTTNCSILKSKGKIDAAAVNDIVNSCLNGCVK
ncbi:uncharacterized protein LOC131606326 [Vicia villosa]|uniref:uncharacterized protein LOC131606326 n=1 Tax=Vicia villosa TaxID=3911 RepID=UPI00273CADA6|nr:uncharacterized protein LOC131606326 [Vicia villosa]